jgi:hypothetical protein
MTTSTTRHACLAALAATLSCGGGGGGGASDGGGTGGSGPASPTIVVPVVPPGDHEAACQSLCTLATGEKVCTAKHAEFCVARCRASTRGLPAACADCLLSTGNGIPISGETISGDSYCTVGGAAKLTACPTACDDGGGAPPASDLETLCQLYCGYYVQAPMAIACSTASAADCLAACRATVASKGRVCAQCLIEQTRPGESCINDACDCVNSFDNDPSFSCTTLCDSSPPM